MFPQLLEDADVQEEVEILTGLGQAYLTLGDVSQATQVSGNRVVQFPIIYTGLVLLLLKLVENDCVNPEKQGYSTTLPCSIGAKLLHFITKLNPAVVKPFGSLLPDILWLLTWQVVGFPGLSLEKLYGLI